MSANGSAAAAPEVLEQWADASHSLLSAFLGKHMEKYRQVLTEQRKTTKNKITYLPPSQFAELSADVSDEIQRRAANKIFTPNAEFSARRNQARMKLSSLCESRFKDLAIDVFLELEARYPALLTKKFAEFNLESREAAPENKQVYVQSLEDLMQHIGSTLDQPEKPNQTSIKDAKPIVDKVADLENEKKKLFDDLVAAKASEAELASKVTSYKFELDKAVENYRNAEMIISKLQAELDRTKLAAQNVEIENAALKSSLRSAEEQNRHLQGRISELVSLNSAIPTPSATVAINPRRISRSSNGSGLEAASDEISRRVSVQSMQAYHKALEAFLLAFSRRSHTEVLESMKGIVHSCRNISEHLEKDSRMEDFRPEDRKMLNEHKSNLSVCLTRLMDVVKANSSAETSASQEEARKISIELHAEALTKTLTVLADLLMGKSVDQWDMAKLRQLVEDQTVQIVTEVQKLLKSMQESVFGSDFEKAAIKVQQIVDSIIKASEEGFQKSPQMMPTLIEEGKGLVENLRRSMMRLQSCTRFVILDPSSSENKKSIAEASYQVVRYTRDLRVFLDKKV